MEDMKKILDNAMKNNDSDYENYYDLMGRLYDCVTTYEKVGFENNKHNLLLSNGDGINFRMSRNHIGHLLGVNMEYLSELNRMDSNAYSNFDKLKYFAENEESFKTFIDPKKKIEENEMFSPYIMNKLSVFLNNIDFKSNNIEYIIKYDPERVYMSEEKGDICDYYIVRKFDENNPYYGVLGLVKDEYSRYDNAYVPATSQMYYTERDLDDFFKRIARKQEIMYPVIHNVTNDKENYHNTFNTYDDTKKAYVKRIKQKAKEFDCTPSAINDLDHTLNSKSSYRSDKKDVLKTINLLINSIKSGNILDDETIYYEIGSNELPEELVELIGLTNAMVNSVDVSGPENNNYFEVVDENQKLKERLEQATDKEKELDEMIEELTKENNTKSEKLNEIKDACQKVLKKI